MPNDASQCLKIVRKGLVAANPDRTGNDRDVPRPSDGHEFCTGGLKQQGIQILDPGCVDKTFPDYFQTLTGVVGH